MRQTSAAVSAKPALIPELDTYCVCVHVVCVCVHVVCVCVCVVQGDLVQWLGVAEISAKAGVLESILMRKCGTVQMGLHCMSKTREQ